MGEPRAVVVDIAAVRAVAQRFDDAATAVDDVARRHLGVLVFDGAVGGRAHTAHADAVHRVLARVSADLADWSRACAEIAEALRGSISRYVEAEASSSEGLG